MAGRPALPVSGWSDAVKRSSYVFLGVTALLVLMADQYTKLLVRRHLPLNVPYQPIEWLDPIFTFRHTQNTGAAFGLLPGLGVVFMAVALIVVVGIIIYYRRVENAPLVLRLALGLQLGGAIGNLIDRARFGYVVDFIDFRWWPVFNVADSGLFIGTFLLAWYILFIDRPTTEPDTHVVEGRSPADDPGW